MNTSKSWPRATSPIRKLHDLLDSSRVSSFFMRVLDSFNHDGFLWNFWTQYFLDLKFFWPKFFPDQIFWTQNLFLTKFLPTTYLLGPKICWDIKQNFIQNFFIPKFFYPNFFPNQIFQNKTFCRLKIFADQISFGTNFFGPKIFWNQNLFWTQNFLWTKIFLDSFFWIQNIFRPKIILGPIFFQTQNFFRSNIFWNQNFFLQKNFETQLVLHWWNVKFQSFIPFLYESISHTIV